MIRLRRLPKKVNITSILEYLLMALILLYSSMWSVFASAQSNTFIRFAYPVLAVLLVVVLWVRMLPRQRVQRLCLLAAVLAVYFLGTRYNLTRYLLYYAVPLLLLTLYMGIKDEQGKPFDLLYKLGDIVCALTVFSLICFIFGTCLGVLPGGHTIEYFFANDDRSCTTYFHLYYAAQTMLMFGRDFVRNCGIFAEAPGFAVFLVIALSTEMFLREKPRLWRCVVYYAAAITTFSTKAILLVLLVLGLKYVITRPGQVTAYRMKAVILPAGALLLAAVAMVLLIDKQNTDSFFIRLDDLFASAKAFATSPLFGTGYYNDQSIIDCFNYARPNEGLSMGVAVLLAQGGLFLLTFYILAMVGCVMRCPKAWRLRMASFFVTYFGLLFVSNMPFSFVAIFLLAFSMEAAHKPLPTGDT